MRDELIELIQEVTTPFWAGFIADHLIANGVILPPCKVGDRIWDKYGYTFEIQKIEIFNDIMLFRCGNQGTEDYMAFYDFEVGTDVFLTQEDAEKALKEKENA